MCCCHNPLKFVMTVGPEECLLSYQFIWPTSHAESVKSYYKYFINRLLSDILRIPFSQVIDDLKVSSEEQEYWLYMEWDILRCGISQYLGIEYENIDSSRCFIEEILYEADNIKVNQIVFPPKDFPKLKIKDK